jgi:hypothetical protein
MPPNTRAFATSSSAAEKLENDRETPAIAGESEVTVNGVFSPK